MFDRNRERSGCQIRGEHCSRRAASTGCRSTAGLRDEFRAQKYRTHGGGSGVSAKQEYEKYFAARRPDKSRRNKNLSIGRICRRKCQKSSGSVITRTKHRQSVTGTCRWHII